eukprot:1268134-Rhodomonas_salina.1
MQLQSCVKQGGSGGDRQATRDFSQRSLALQVGACVSRLTVVGGISVARGTLRPLSQTLVPVRAQLRGRVRCHSLWQQLGVRVVLSRCHGPDLSKSSRLMSRVRVYQSLAKLGDDRIAEPLESPVGHAHVVRFPAALVSLSTKPRRSSLGRQSVAVVVTLGSLRLGARNARQPWLRERKLWNFPVGCGG